GDGFLELPPGAKDDTDAGAEFDDARAGVRVPGAVVPEGKQRTRDTVPRAYGSGDEMGEVTIGHARGQLGRVAQVEATNRWTNGHRLARQQRLAQQPADCWQRQRRRRRVRGMWQALESRQGGGGCVFAIEQQDAYDLEHADIQALAEERRDPMVQFIVLAADLGQYAETPLVREMRPECRVAACKSLAEHQAPLRKGFAGGRSVVARRDRDHTAVDAVDWQ